MAKKSERLSKNYKRPGLIFLGAGLAMGLANRSNAMINKAYKKTMRKKK